MQVQFGYLVVAGSAGEMPPEVPGIASQPGFATPTESWFLVQARGNKDEDSKYAYFVATSFTPDVQTESPDGERPRRPAFKAVGLGSGSPQGDILWPRTQGGSAGFVNFGPVEASGSEAAL